MTAGAASALTLGTAACMTGKNSAFIRRLPDTTGEYGNDELLLRRVAEFTGGRFNPRPADVFDAAGRVIPSTLRLWPVLLGLAILLNLAELLLRKWRGVAETLRKP